MPQKLDFSEIITVFPYDQGVDAKLNGKSIHDNPYKSPNTAKTDDVKSEAWLRGFNNECRTPIAHI
jgi:hypothetical protein